VSLGYVSMMIASRGLSKYARISAMNCKVAVGGLAKIINLLKITCVAKKFTGYKN